MSFMSRSKNSGDGDIHFTVVPHAKRRLAHPSSSIIHPRPINQNEIFTTHRLCVLNGRSLFKHIYKVEVPGSIIFEECCPMEVFVCAAVPPPCIKNPDDDDAAAVILSLIPKPLSVLRAAFLIHQP